jgi:hypothetical protein
MSGVMPKRMPTAGAVNPTCSILRRLLPRNGHLPLRDGVGAIRARFEYLNVEKR